MDNLELNGKEYVKVSVAAKQTGYSSDYIGQLVRAGKIEGQLVGRSWYVLKDAVMQYKKGTPRSNFEKTRQDVETSIRKESGATHLGLTDAEKSVFLGAIPEYRKRLLGYPISYQKDDETLIPLVQRYPADTPLHVKAQPSEADSVEIEKREYATEEVEEDEITYKNTDITAMTQNRAVVARSLDSDEEESDDDDDATVVTESDSYNQIEPAGSILHTSDLLNRKNYHSRTADFYHIPTSKPTSPASYVSKLPMLLTAGVTLIILLGSVFIQDVRVFKGGGPGTERPTLAQHFEIASVATLIKAFNSKK